MSKGKTIRYSGYLPKDGCPFDGCEGEWQVEIVRCNGCGRRVNLPKPEIGNAVRVDLAIGGPADRNPWEQPDWDEWLIGKLYTSDCCYGMSRSDFADAVRVFAQLIRARDRRDHDAVKTLLAKHGLV